MTDKWTRIVHHTKATQILGQTRHHGDALACYYLIKAIEALEAFDKYNFKKLRHSVHALDLDVQAQFHRQDRIVAKRAQADGRKKYEDALSSPVNNTDASDRRISTTPSARRGSPEK